MTKLSDIIAATATNAADSAMLVLDPTAKDGPRVHEMRVNDSVKPFTFEPGKGLPLPTAIAIKFLAKGFKLVDDKGSLIPWQLRPKQPDELGAGESIKLSDNETIARVDELSTEALLQRALEMPGGEQFAAKGERGAMIDFIVATTIARNKAKVSTQSELGDDEFVPEAEAEEAA